MCAHTQIQFLNNAGFNWNLRADAIDFLYEGTAALSANDLLSNIKQTIQSPLAYHFMDVQVRRCCHSINQPTPRPTCGTSSEPCVLQIPDEYKPYITFVPSNHTADTPPLQVRPNKYFSCNFSFRNANVLELNG